MNYREASYDARGSSARTRQSQFRVNASPFVSVTVKAYLLGLGDDVQMKTLKFFFAFKRIKNFACVEVRKQTGKVLIYAKVPGQELELCDGAIWLDNLLILFQAKSRNRNDATADIETESKWFKSKVGKKAVSQLADSVRYDPL